MRIATLIVVAALATAAGAQGKPVLSVLPVDGQSITNYYKQGIYDTHENKIGDVIDLVVSPEGKIVALMGSFGGFLGLGEKIIALDPKLVVLKQQKSGRTWLQVALSKDDINVATGFRFERDSYSWKIAPK